MNIAQIANASGSKIPSGEVAKRLCSGLQSRLDGFDSRPRLHKIKHLASLARV
jgi:hypothetical protein